MTKRVLDVLETDGGWLTAEGVALEAGISDGAAKRALHRFKNGGQVETRFADGHNEWRFVEGAEPAKDGDEESPVTTGKTCSRCKETKPASHYGKNRAAPDGLAYYCKPCEKARREEKKAMQGSRTTKATAFEAPESEATNPVAPTNGWRSVFVDPSLTQLEKLADLVGVSPLDEAAAISREIAGVGQ